MNNISKPNPKNKSLKKYISLFIGLVLIALGAVVWYNYPVIRLHYLNSKYNPFKPGEKVYAADWLVNEVSEYGAYNITLYELVRPMNADDIDKMNIGLAEKALIKSQLKSSDKPFLIDLGWQVSSDSLCKYKSAFIGTYFDYKVLDEKSDKEYHPMVYFNVKLNRRSLFKAYPYHNQIPSGYVKVDGPFYIRANHVTNKELKTFRKLK